MLVRDMIAFLQKLNPTAVVVVPSIEDPGTKSRPTFLYDDTQVEIIEVLDDDDFKNDVQQTPLPD